MGLLTHLYLLLLALLATSSAADIDTSGLQIDYTQPATCSRPSENGDSISVHYRGTLKSTGAEFDQSYKRGNPFTFKLGGGMVISGWDYGLLDMCPGEKRTLTIPPELGYGEYGSGDDIPPGSWLVFETELMDIVGVEQESVSLLPASTQEAAKATETSEGTFGIATAPPEPEPSDEEGANGKDGQLQATPLEPQGEEDQQPSPEDPDRGECRLLGPFALLIQGALGAFALLSLVWKRYRETPKRPWRIWFFDVSKQVVGTFLTHILNLAMSMVGNVDVVNAAGTSSKGDEQGRMPNPCSYYLLNLGIDTTIGIPVLWILLKVLHSAFMRTPLATPPESIKSGHYGEPPQTAWWLKQSLIYFIGLVGMKLFVFFLFQAMPFLPWIGDWALRWTNGNEALEITFVMFIFPLCMNAIQYWIIDNLIMDKKRGDDQNKGGYQVVQGDDHEDERGARTSTYENREEDDSSGTVVEEEHEYVRGKDQVEDAPLREVNPTPLPERRSEDEGK